MVTKLEKQYNPEENLSSIQKIDEKISFLREYWQDVDEKKKDNWLNMINDQLDQRLQLMSIRDNMA